MVVVALCHCCERHPDTNNLEKIKALDAIKENNSKERPSADCLRPHLSGIYHLLLNTNTAEEHRNLAISALRSIMRLECMQRNADSVKRAGHFQPPPRRPSTTGGEASATRVMNPFHLV